jgi:hypothetical protein
VREVARRGLLWSYRPARSSIMIAKLVMVASCHSVRGQVQKLGQAPTIREASGVAFL